MSWLDKKNPLCLDTEWAHRISRVLFLVIYTVYMAARMSLFTNFDRDISLNVPVKMVSWCCVIAAVAVIVFLCGYTRGQLLFILFIAAVFAGVYISTEGQDYQFFHGIMIVFAAREIKWETVLRYTLGLFVVIIGGVFVCSRIGVISSKDLGFYGDFALERYIMFLVVLWVLVRYNSLKFFEYFIWLAAAAFVWIRSGSKITTLVILLLTVVVFAMKTWGDRLLNSGIFKKICMGAFPALAIFSYAAAALYNSDNSLYVRLDKLLFSGKFGYTHWYLSKYTLTMFGQKIKQVSLSKAAAEGTEARILDNFYMKTFVNSGLIPFIIVLGLFMFVMYRAVKKNNRGEIAVLLVLSVYGVYENYLNRLPFNVLMFEMGYQSLDLVAAEASNLQNQLRKFWGNFKRYQYLLYELVKKGITLKYRRSYLGIIWSMLEPILTTAVLTVVFGTLFGRDDKEYPLYILCGRLIYSYFSQGTKTALRSIRQHGQMIKKVYVPKYMYPLSSILYTYVIFLISLIVLVVLGIIVGDPPSLRWFGLILPLFTLLIMTLGVGMILATVGVFFRDMEYLWDVLMMLIMYCSAIFYTTERLEKSGYAWILNCNPLYGIIVNVRNIVMYGTFDWEMMTFSICFSVIALVIGMYVFNKYQDDFILYI